ncbi:MAG: ribonuclease HI [Treponema sp.]|jgi:ribonuclease HI|nr:ribonuclease HI [Treponema sp.]
METELKIFTDGGCSGNPGPGGWAYVITADKGDGTAVAILAEKWGAEGDTTNNRMELRAVIAALEAVPGLPAAAGPEAGPEAGPAAGPAAVLNAAAVRITVVTDSQYVQKGITQWVHNWKKNDWQTADRKPVKNRDLWEHLDRLSSGMTLHWAWVRGHTGNELNERCDRMVQRAIRSLS